MNGKTVRALNSIFQQWQIQAGDSWSISGEPCSGVALSRRDSVFEDPANNPAIRCDCSSRNNTLCHITGLKVVGRNEGTIPEELLGLPFLTLLKIERNFFSGPLPAFLGNMSGLKSLSIDDNSFLGPIPGELGKLNMLHKPKIDMNFFSGQLPACIGYMYGLESLSLDNNNFSGTLPPELGTLANLEELYISSCGFSGEIPSTFANLERLRIVWASDNAFTGKIPDFVGNNWTKLRKLRFQGNSFEGPIPSSFAKLTSLTSLRIGDIYNGISSLDFVLRNVLLTGTLPSYLTELNSLEKLDLSFNNLTGTIPSYMFRMHSLKHLFLGNNSLTGGVPNVQTTNLKTIDLSYNLLSGDLPSGVDTIRQLNLVGNNFTPNSSNIGLFPGLECLQRSFPCNRDAPRSQVRGTDTPELYNSSRMSPGSLRYYGLGLENGTYNVNLFFAEIGSLDRTSRRVFNVYIQGTQRLRDFYISKEANGVLRAATRNFTVNITENHLEIHLFWAGKGTCSTPSNCFFGPSISAVRVVANIRPKENRTTLIAGVTVPVVVMLLILVFAFFYKKRKGEYEEEEVPVNICTRPITFSFSELKAATKDFSPSNKLGEGGFGTVYKAWDLHENNQSLELVDPTLAEFDENEALRVVRVALLCTQGSPSMRPPMSRVVAMLAGDIDVSSVITRPSYLIDWNFRDSTGTTLTKGKHQLYLQ
ncbi:hypothetical protein V6N12_029549 [Hibiscus sabdariffa]|uniref:non-specific serine/threonine protein kinase n=1 Tax=Hibiscus sabdariffa TaxID=183260 RepID=A0ABR2CWG1_9ROSI